MKTTLVSTELDVTRVSPAAVPGPALPGLARYPAVGGAAYAVAIDETRKRFLVGGPGGIVEVLPPLPATVDDHFYPAAASIAGKGGTRWATQVVAWNRGTADTTGATVDATVDRAAPPDRLDRRPLARGRPSPSEPGKLVSQADPIADEMGGPDTSGALRFTTSAHDDEVRGLLLLGPRLQDPRGRGDLRVRAELR